MRAHGRHWRWTAALGLPLLLAACEGIDPTPNSEPVSEADRARYVQHRVEDAQSFRVQGRFESAERQLRLALSGDPDHARAHALMARTLHDLGRDDEAAPHAARARALSPPRAPLPDSPLGRGDGVLFVLVPPEKERFAGAGVPGEWDDPETPRLLAQRIRTRLPGAQVLEASPGAVAQAEAWLRSEQPRAVISVRADQARCGESAKDGPFALAALTVIAARSGALPDAPARVRADDEDPPFPPRCTDAALARALEEALALPGVARALEAPRQPAQDAWAALAVQALIPVSEIQLGAEIERARREADESDVAPDLASEIARAEAERAQEQPLGASPIDPDGDEAQAAIEAEVAAERRRRDELLAALRVDELAQRAPTPEEVAVLRVGGLGDPSAVGPRLARERAKGREVESRLLYAPDGTVLARFYFEPGADTPLLREEETNLDGVPDRWTAYADGRPVEVWEDRGPSGHVNAHLWLAPDGLSTERIEIDMDGNGRPERAFRYADGRLLAGEQDTDGDGVMDRFERFGPDGDLVSRDDDLDGDGAIDVHSDFRDGKLLRRELRNQALLESLPGPQTLRP